MTEIEHRPGWLDKDLELAGRQLALIREAERLIERSHTSIEAEIRADERRRVVAWLRTRAREQSHPAIRCPEMNIVNEIVVIADILAGFCQLPKAP